ncbi:hypothetical protein [Telluribacter humicola]|uniref:hypothetical protein n=1 Tax=Telluribacter humicola TaxID=1720261 RepID=UPI001A97272D|nr:hypothetical protein [Telluribacter humicola]
MSNIKDILGCTGSETRILRSNVNNKNARSRFVALVFTDPDAVKFGDSYTYSGGGSAVTVDAKNVAKVLRDMAFKGAAHFFGNPTISGRKGKPTEVMTSKARGTQVETKPTGEVNEKAEFDFEHFFLNIKFFNDLRENSRGRDVFMFTDATVQILRANEHQPIFKEIGHVIEDDIQKSIEGSFAVVWTGLRGELEPFQGVNLADLDASSLKYTFADATGLTNLTLVAGCEGECKKYNRTAAGAIGITRAIKEAAGGCGAYSLYYNCNDALPATITGTVDAATGAVSITVLPAGTHKFTVAYENEVGIWGSHCFTVVATA